jgi:hypothetical protein
MPDQKLDIALAELRQWMIRNIIAAARPDAELAGDRSPFTLEPLVDPEGLHLLIVRDGRDVVVSRAFHLFSHPELDRGLLTRPSLAALLKRFQGDPWVFHREPQLLLSDEELVRRQARFWQRHLACDRATMERHPRLAVATVRYEDLHRDPVGESARLFRFLGVDPAETAPIDDITRPGTRAERPDQLRRKGIVGDWRNYFTDQARQWFADEAGDELARQGYSNDANNRETA